MKKKRSLKKSIYIFLFVLLVCYGGSLAIYICLYFGEFRNNNSENNTNNNIIDYIGNTFIFTNMIVFSIIFVSTTLFACYFNSFLSQGILLFYIITLIIMLIFELPSFFIILEYIIENKQQLLTIIVIIFFLNIIEIISGFASILISISLKIILIKEIEQSPLNFIGLDMTEKKYNKILHKSGETKRSIRRNTSNNIDYEMN